MTKPVSPVAERFWKQTPTGFAEDCWEWLGARMKPHGYGILGRKDGERWRCTYAHRLSWELHHGPIPDGMHVLHKCDNPPCVNPHHLSLGTRTDNMRDMIEKGRAAPGSVKARRGVHNGFSKLGTDDVLVIRRRFPETKAADLAREFNVSLTHIYRILNREAWGHLV